MTPKRECAHKVRELKDGKIVCLRCGEILPEDKPAVRACPQCGGAASAIGSGSRARCVKCGIYFDLVIKFECPLCHKSDRVSKVSTAYTADEERLTFKCFGCNATFGKVFKKKSSVTTSSTTSTYNRTSRGRTGHCPQCRSSVTSYSKRGGYCSTCKEYVYPHVRHPKPFILEESL